MLVLEYRRCADRTDVVCEISTCQSRVGVAYLGLLLIAAIAAWRRQAVSLLPFVGGCPREAKVEDEGFPPTRKLLPTDDEKCVDDFRCASSP